MEPGNSKKPSAGITHEWIDQCALAMDLEIAEMLRREPALLQRPKNTINRWIKQAGTSVPAVFREWQDIVNNWPLENILELLSSSGQEARRLRQSSPFCGILPEKRRIAILKEFQARKHNFPYPDL